MALLIAALPGATAYLLFSGTWTIASGLALESVGWRADAAARLVTIGVAASFLLAVPHPAIFVFAPLFMMKIVMGFSGSALPVEA